MLFVDPQRRPLASQILQHPWIANRKSLPETKLPLKGDATQVKTAMMATYKAIKNTTQNPAVLEPVTASALAKRRGIAPIRPMSSSEV